MTATSTDVLTKARDLIADPARWTTGTYARDADGCRVMPDNPYAVCFCTYGAVQRAAAELRAPRLVLHKAYETLQLRAQAGHWPHSTVAAINDQLGHEAVLNLLDQSIEAARP